MRRHNDLSDEAFGLLADMIGGQVLKYANTSPVLRKMAYTVDGKVIDNELVREIHDLGFIWPDHFDIPGDVTREISYAKTKVHEAYEWLENHFVTGGTVIKADAEEVAADAQAGAAKVEGAVDAVEKAV